MERSYAHQQGERGSMIKQYLSVLIDSLKKKNVLLDDVHRISKQQNELLQQSTVDFEHYDQSVDEKDKFVQQLVKIEDGFELIYDKIKDELPQRKEEFKEEVQQLQEYIALIMEKSMTIQALENRNQQMVQQALQEERKRLGEGRRSSKVAMDYYQSVNKNTVSPPQFMDEKQ